MQWEQQVHCDAFRSRTDALLRDGTAGLLGQVLEAKVVCKDCARVVAAYALEIDHVFLQSYVCRGDLNDPQMVYSYGSSAGHRIDSLWCYKNTVFGMRGGSHLPLVEQRVSALSFEKYSDRRWRCGDQRGLDAIIPCFLLTDPVTGRLQSFMASRAVDGQFGLYVTDLTSKEASREVIYSCESQTRYRPVDETRWLCRDTDGQGVRLRVFVGSSTVPQSTCHVPRIWECPWAPISQNRVAVARHDNTLTLYDLATGAPLDVRKVCSACVKGFQPSPSSSLVVDRVTGVLYTACKVHSWSAHV